MRKSLAMAPKLGFLAGILLLGLSACDELPASSAPVSPNVLAGGSTVERDVERPDVFSVSEKALWDGRPSLGGVWVAHPDTIDPERVVITNTENGKTVIGALFRRERDNPGPAIQISSDTASALGVLAGAPTELSVVVLRRETIEIAPPEPEIAPEPAVEETPEAAATETPAEPDTAAADLGDIVEEVLSEVPVAAPVVAPTNTPAPVAAPLAKPFIQIGTFSTEQNADALVAILANEGVQASVRTNDSGGTTLYRVVSGPASNMAERDERLRIIKSLGFADAFIFG